MLMVRLPGRSLFNEVLYSLLPRFVVACCVILPLSLPGTLARAGSVFLPEFFFFLILLLLSLICQDAETILHIIASQDEQGRIQVRRNH